MIERTHRIPGNQAIPLSAIAGAAVVLSGSAMVFAVERESGVRRPLFGVDPGEPLLPLLEPPDAAWRIVAVPLESQGLELGRDTREWAGLVALENWLAKIGQAAGSLEDAADVHAIEPAQKVELTAGQRGVIEEGLTFVRVESGGARLSGAPVSAGETVAMVPGLWLEAGENSEWRALPNPPEDAAEILNDTVTRIIPAFIHALDVAERRREEADRARFASRRRLNVQLSLVALEALVGVARAPRRDSPAAGGGQGGAADDALFQAVRAVAENLGVAVRRPPSPHRGRDPLREIAQASGLRTRVVALGAGWWRSENGPLVAFRSTGSPVALLPSRSGFLGSPRYVVLDPTDGSRRKINAEVAAELDPLARMLYRPLPEDLSTRGLLGHVLLSRRGDLRTIAIAGFAAGALAMAGPQGAAILIGQAIPDADTSMVWQVVAGMVAAAFGSTLFLLAQAVATLRIQTLSFTTLQSGVWDHLLKLSPPFFRRFTAGQLGLRANAITRIHQLLTADALRSVFAAAASVLTLVLTFWYSAGLGLVALFSGAVLLGGSCLGGRALCRAQERSQQVEETLAGFVLQAIQAVSKLRVAGASGRAFSHWARVYSAKRGLGLTLQTIKDRIRLLNMLAPPAASAFGFLYLLSHPIPLGSFLAANAALTVFLTAIVSGSDTCSGLMLVASLWQRTRSIIEARPEIDGGKTHPGRLRGVIAVEGVTFRYRADGPLILDSVTVKAEPGECIALTGPSGSGKSTLLNLLLRFETPQAGAIYLDGRELSSLDIAAVRRQIGVVTQDARILSGSVLENICAGGATTIEDAWEAARAAGIAEDIEKMPMGMHTVVSEGGGNLSGGQRQRLLIARALVLRPSVLMFDEATSALDNRTQAIVTESLKRLKTTRILVAHRLSTIRGADRIYVIEKGRVVQQGRFEELIAEPGLFARLARRQRV